MIFLGSNGEIIIRGRDCDAYPNLSRYSWTTYKKYGKFLPAKTTEDRYSYRQDCPFTFFTITEGWPSEILT